MPAGVIPINTRRGMWTLLRLALPGRPEQDIGVLLLDAAGGRLYLRLRSHWEDIAGPEEIEVLSALEGDLRTKASDMGAEELLRWLEDCLSHTLRISERERVAVDSFTRVLDRLFEQHVEKLEVRPFRTHLPLYSLRAAATRFGEEMPVEAEDWVRAPADLRLDENMFVAHVVGRSMEPRIPDGSLNVFRAPVVGSRQGKLVLVELLGEIDETARYTIKRYSSEKVQRREGEEEDPSWEHKRIRLDPFNPEFQGFELEPGRLRVIAEWLRTLD